MLFDGKLTLLRQMLSLVILSVLTLIGGFAFDIHPRLRLSAEIATKALVGAVLVAFAVYSVALLLLAAERSGLRRSLASIAEQLRTKSVWAVIGSGITAAAGEELFFRGIVVGGLARLLPELAVAANALLMLLLYFRGRPHLSYALLKAGEGTFYAWMFLSSRSLGMVGLCHALLEIGENLLLRSEWFKKLSAEPIRPRLLFAPSKPGTRIIGNG